MRASYGATTRSVVHTTPGFLPANGSRNLRGIETFHDVIERNPPLNTNELEPMPKIASGASVVAVMAEAVTASNPLHRLRFLPASIATVYPKTM